MAPDLPCRTYPFEAWQLRFVEASGLLGLLHDVTRTGTWLHLKLYGSPIPIRSPHVPYPFLGHPRVPIMARKRGLQEALCCFSPLAGPPDLQHHTVKLHIYDLPGLALGLNTCLKGILGIYHTGVEVHGREWSFSSNGIVECCPGGCAYPLYRESVTLGTTSLSEDEVKMLLHRFDSAWVAAEYHCIRRNCSDFSEALCVALGVARPPRIFSCSCYPGKEAARHADLKRAMAAR